MADDARVVASWRKDFLNSRYGEVERNLEIAPQALNELARIYFLAGEWGEARAKLKQALERDPRSAQAHNNLGASFAAAGEMAPALEQFTAALAADSLDAGVWLNLGLTRYAAGDSSGGDQALAVGLRRSGGFDQACRLLGLPATEPDSRQGKDQTSMEAARSLLRAAIGGPRGAVRGAPARGTAAPTVTGMPVGEKMGVGSYLYWKE